MPSYIVKAKPDEDWYCIWSTIVDSPCSWGSRNFLESVTLDPREIAPDRFARADKNGTSAAWPDWPDERQPFGWTDEDFILMEDAPERPDGDGCWMLPRANLRAFCEALDAEQDTAPLCKWERHETPATQAGLPMTAPVRASEETAVDHQPLSIQDSVWCSVRECDWREDGPVSFVEHALLASGVVVPAAEPEAVGCGYCGDALRGETGYTGQAAYHRECARLVYGDRFREDPAAESDEWTIIVTAEEYARLAEILARPPRVLPRLAALLNKHPAEPEFHCDICGSDGHDALGCDPNPQRVAPARDGLAERVRALRDEVADIRPGLIGRVDRSWIIHRLDALLAEDAATEGGEGRG